MTQYISILLGIPLLIWGRKLFWLFVGTLGFITGFWLAQRLFSVNQEWLLLLIGAALGLFGLLFAIFLQKFALTVTGFLAGAYLSISAIEFLNINVGPWNLMLYLIGGMIGTLLVISVFDWALIILSSLVGAALISQSSLDLIQLETAAGSIIFIVLLLIGIIVQYDQKARE